MSVVSQPQTVTRAQALKGLLARAWDSDVGYSFRTSPVAIGAAAVTLIIILATTLCRLHHAARPVRRGHPQPDGRLHAAGRSRRRIGHDLQPRRRQPGPRHVFGDPVRLARVAADRHGVGDLLAAARRHARPDRGLCRRADRGADHAHRRHPAVVPGHPGGAAGVRHRPRPDPSLAARADDVHRDDGGDRPFELGAVCAHGARLDAGGEAQGICRRRAGDRPAEHSR